MITGRQIREARDKLGLARNELARRAGLLTSVVRRAEATDGEAVITTAQIAALRLIFVKAGVEFGPETERDPE